MSRLGFPESYEQGFADRVDAGRALARALASYALNDPVVLGLARGGVPVAAEVARALGAPLQVSVARKIGAPGQSELALGAVTSHGPATYDQRLLRAFHTDERGMAAQCERERDEARRREAMYQQGGAVPLAGRDVVLVDDGLATGATARAAVRMLKEAGPRRIVLAVPVGAPEAVELLGAEADDVVCVLQPFAFNAVGQWYADFRPTIDGEIVRLLREINPA